MLNSHDAGWNPRSASPCPQPFQAGPLLIVPEPPDKAVRRKLTTTSVGRISNPSVNAGRIGNPSYG